MRSSDGVAPAPTLHLVHVHRDDPREQLAMDEALLRAVDQATREEDRPAGFLRLWESPRHFVVLGASRRRAREVDVAACEADGVPILRRGSGGGTVLQGPGCLNAAVILPLSSDAALADVSRSHAYFVDRTARALSVGAARRGSSDLALRDLKFGGSAQKRTARALLHHSSILYAFDLDLIGRYLREPETQPEYRRGRSHREFVTNLPLAADEIRARIARAWDAEPVAVDWTPPDLTALLETKYARDDWHAKF